MGDLDLDDPEQSGDKDKKVEETKEPVIVEDNDGWGDDDIDIL